MYLCENIFDKVSKNWIAIVIHFIRNHNIILFYHHICALTVYSTWQKFKSCYFYRGIHSHCKTVRSQRWSRVRTQWIVSLLTNSRDYFMYYTKYITHNKSRTLCKYLVVVDLFLPYWQPSRLCSALWNSVYMSVSTSSDLGWRLLEGRDDVCLLCIMLSI